MSENEDDDFEKFDRAHERLKRLLGRPLYEREKLQDAFRFNGHPERILDELEHALDGKAGKEAEDIRQWWVKDHYGDLV